MWTLNLHLRSDDARCLTLAYSLHACAVLDEGPSPDAYSLHACACRSCCVATLLVCGVSGCEGNRAGFGPTAQIPPLCAAALFLRGVQS